MSQQSASALDLPQTTPGWAHRLWQRLPAEPRRIALANGLAALVPRPESRARVVPDGVASDGVMQSAVMRGAVVAGELSRPSGLGEAARLMLAALRRAGVAQIGCDIGEPITRTRLQATDWPDAMPLVLHVNAPLLPLVLLRLPRAALRGRRRVGFWYWELPQLPRAWRAGFGLVDEIWVPSRFTAAAMTQCAPSARVRVVPLPLAVVPPQPSGKTRAAFGLPAAAVVVLVSFSLASSFHRKNPLAAIAAFRAAFGGRTDRLLVLKITGLDAHPRDAARIADAMRGCGNIRLLADTLSPADRHALTACADIVLSLHRAEGFGLVPAEAMLLGVPVVATDWSGPCDYLAEDAACLVPARLVPACDDRGVFNVKGAVWAEPEIEAAAEHLRRLAQDPALRARIGAAGRARAQAMLGDAPLLAALRGLA